MVEGEVFIVDNKGECSQKHLEGSRTGRVVDGIWPADWVCPWGERERRSRDKEPRKETKDDQQHKYSSDRLLRE